MSRLAKQFNFKAERLLRSAQKTLLKGDRETARELVVLAMTTEDAVSALDKLLPRVPEPEVDLDLGPEQVARIMSCVKDLEKRNQKRVAAQILSKIERIEAQKKRSRKA